MRVRGALVEHGRPGGGLRRELTSFVGREREVEAVARLLSDAPLVTLAGPGGAGKTRLAMRVARKVESEAGSERVPEEVTFIELAGLSDPSLVPQTLAVAIGAVA